MAQPPLSGLSEAERTRAFERFDLLRLSLEEGVPLARVARDRGIALRTARRWAANIAVKGLAGLARKGRSDRGKRHLSDKATTGHRRPRLEEAAAIRGVDPSPGYHARRAARGVSAEL